MKTSKMQAAVLAAPNQVRLVEVEIPKPREREVRVRLEGCGVCGSNLAPWEGRPWFKYPFAPGELGHEGWGRVDAVGPGATQCSPGERVALLSYHAFAEYDVAPESCVVPLPEALAGKPFPGEALGCAMNVFERCEVRPGEVVAIVGIGFLGAVLTSLSVRAGATVLAISRRPFALDIAARLGAAATFRPTDETADAVKTFTEGAGCACVIEAAGQQSALDLATELTQERGRLIIAGYHQDGLRQVNMQLWNWRGLDVINAHERAPERYARGISAAAHAVASGELEPWPLYTHTFGLDQLGLALESMREKPRDFLKALVSL